MAIFAGTFVGGLILREKILIILGSAHLFCLLAICLHEFGHAVSATLLRGEVVVIKLGRSALPEGAHRKFKFLGWPCEIYALPYAGSVHVNFFSEPYYRTRLCLMLAAGPLISLTAAIPGYFLLEQKGNYSTWLILGLNWSFLNLILFLGTAIPYERFRLGKKRSNDGMGVINALRLDNSEIHQKVLAAKWNRAIQTEGGALKELPLEELIAKHEANPDNLATLAFLSDRLAQEDDPRHPAILLKLASNLNAPTNHCSQILDNYLTHQLSKKALAVPGLLDQMSARLLEMNDSLTTRGTRGSILIHIGRIEEGSAILKDVMVRSTSLVDETYGNIFLALAARQQGNLELALNHAKRAHEIDPNCPALKRVSDLLEASPPENAPEPSANAG